MKRELLVKKEMAVSLALVATKAIGVPLVYLGALAFMELYG